MLCVLDIEGDNVSVLEGVPDDISPGQVRIYLFRFFLQKLQPLDCHQILKYLIDLQRDIKSDIQHPCCFFCRRFGLQVIQVWFLLAGGTSLSDSA